MSEDWEYDARFGALNIRLVHCPTPLSDTRIHAGDRLTSKPITQTMIQNYARLIKTLHDGAIKVGVALDSPEMKHFSRWAFLTARQAGECGLIDESKACFNIARLSALPQRAKGLDMRAYSILGKVCGFQSASIVFATICKLLHRGPGPETLKQSWMD